MTDITEWLRKCSKAIYLACEQSVADDISLKLRQAAAEIERLRKGWLDQAARDATGIVRLEVEIEQLKRMLGQEGFDIARNYKAQSAEIERLREALGNLADTADDVGVQFFDTDTMHPLVEKMQATTQAARAALGEPKS